MHNAEEVLVVILASTLTVFLILGIILLIIMIKIALVVRRVTAKAEDLADKAEAVGDFFQHAATPMVIGRILGKFADLVFKKPSKSKRKR